MTVIKKPDLITKGTPPNVSMRLPETYDIDLSKMSECPWGLDYTKKLYINGTLWTDAAYGKWMVWDDST
jgi:hypothetical protein